MTCPRPSRRCCSRDGARHTIAAITPQLLAHRESEHKSTHRSEYTENSPQPHPLPTFLQYAPALGAIGDSISTMARIAQSKLPRDRCPAALASLTLLDSSISLAMATAPYATVTSEQQMRSPCTTAKTTTSYH